jgi:hypothetical protein
MVAVFPSENVSKLNSKQQCTAGCLLGLLFDPEDVNNIILLNQDKLVPDCTASHCKR